MLAVARAGIRYSRAARPALPSRHLHRSVPAWEDVQVPFPSAGDSITDGSVLSFEKQVGQFVEQDETFITIETDKVGAFRRPTRRPSPSPRPRRGTGAPVRCMYPRLRAPAAPQVSIDVRAPTQGVVKQFLVAEGDTVDVGASLAIIDSDGAPDEASAAPAQAPVAPAAAPSPASAPAPAAPAPAPPAPAPAAQGGDELPPNFPFTYSYAHTPLIQFRHGRGRARQQAQQQPAAASAPAASAAPAGLGAPKGPSATAALARVEYRDGELGPSALGRKPLSEAEMAAIDSGGASEWD